MSPLVFGLLGLAAFGHAAWNVLLKTSGDPLRTSGRAMIAGVTVGLPFAVAAYLLAGGPAIPPAALALAVASGLLETVYFVFLSAAYRRGDLSVVYPIARGTAPLFAIAAGVGILGERLGPLGALGVAGLAAGILVIQRPWRAIASARHQARRTAREGRIDRASAVFGAFDRAILFALATGLTIAAYSAVDSVGAKLVAPWIFAALLFPVTAVSLVLWIRLVDRAAVDSGAGWPRAASAGLIALGGYLLVLLAYTVAPLTVVAPLRESAVVLVSGWGSLRLGESADRRDATRRLIGAALIVAGAFVLTLDR
ncbi:MAG: EamA family transporter [Chloroflexota bacterium]